MGRPPLDVGAHGNISFRDLGPKRVRAMAYVRDPDGRRREVTALSTSRSAARAELLRRISTRTGVGGELTGDTLLADVAAVWMVEVARLVADGQRAPNTARLYRSALNLHVLPGVGALRVREATVPRLNAFVVTMRTQHRSAITRTARTVLNGIMGHAVRSGALTVNPMREVARITSDPVRAPRALTSLERERWVTAMEDDVVACRQDLPDLTLIMLGTGVRIGECLAVCFDDIGPGAKTVAIDWSITRITGRGLCRMPTKTAAGERTLRLPAWAADIITRRGDQHDWTGPLFPDSKGGWRDPSNTSRNLRDARERAGFGWVTSHVFRKTVATVLDEAGLTAREIADQLGHAHVSMTQNVYLGRKTGGDAAAVALGDMFGDRSAGGSE